MTNKPPFLGILLEAMVVMAIMNGRPPSMEDYPELPATDPLWDLMRECWNQEPSERPTMVDVLGKVCNLVSISSQSSFPPDTDFDKYLCSSATSLKLKKHRALQAIEEAGTLAGAVAYNLLFHENLYQKLHVYFTMRA